LLVGFRSYKCKNRKKEGKPPLILRNLAIYFLPADTRRGD
jgi:hypothetical protein